jgi:prophage regulatory protein
VETRSAANKSETRFVTPKAVCGRTSLSRATLDRLVAAGDFPKPIRITDRRLAYKVADVDAWIEARIADAPVGRSEKEHA